ncbi:AAA family ATPase [uncultured Luteimonas sp.]|uniref:AAA family ATPase n=1 Tax=uncultured Luteimonas sp. TaxID=453144 RepID=UPI0026178B68|nr:AAA family ATPase [uncultured Luteimonas sp.]
MTEIIYSRGFGTKDNQPENRSAPDFAAFCDAILQDRSKAKGEAWIAAAFRDGRRSNASAMPRRWLPIDLDCITPEQCQSLLSKLPAYGALVHTTASHTDTAPRLRIIVELAFEADALSAKATVAMLCDQLGVPRDPACDAAAQIVYTPLVGAWSHRFTGQPVVPVPGVHPATVTMPDVIPDAHPLACLLAEMDLARALNDLRVTKPGGRNNLLSAVAHRTGGYVTAGRLSRDDTTAAMMDAVAAWGEPDKSRATIERQLTEGGNTPSVLLVPEVDRSVIPVRRQPFNDGPRIRNGADLMQRHFQPTTWIIDGILPAGITLLSGDPKVGKSFLSLQFAFAVATGCQLWNGRKGEARGRTLYLALEDNDKRMQKRINGVKLDRGQHSADMSLFDYATEWERGAAGVEEIRNYLHANPDCRLIIIDTIAAWRDEDPGRKSAYQHDYQVGQLLKPLGREFDVSILLVTHNRKQSSDDSMQKISGTQGLLGSVDGALVLEKGARGAEHSTLVVNGRDIEDPSELAITRTATGFWACLGKADEVARSSESQAVMQALVALGGIGSTKAIQGAMEEPIKLATLQRRLSRMASRREIQRDHHDLYSLAQGGGISKKLPEPPDISPPGSDGAGGGGRLLS